MTHERNHDSSSFSSFYQWNTAFSLRSFLLPVKKETTHAIILHDNFVIREVLEESVMQVVSRSSQFAELFQSFSDDVIRMHPLTLYAYTLIQTNFLILISFCEIPR